MRWWSPRRPSSAWWTVWTVCTASLLARFNINNLKVFTNKTVKLLTFSKVFTGQEAGPCQHYWPPPNENVLLLSSAGAVCGGLPWNLMVSPTSIYQPASHLTMLTSISGNWRGSVTEAGARSRLRLVLGLMIGFEIPELSFSSASSGFSDKTNHHVEIFVDLNFTIDCIILAVTESVHSLSFKFFRMGFWPLRFFKITQGTWKIFKVFKALSSN